MDQEDRNNPLSPFGIIPQIFDGHVVLTCQKHHFAYDPKRRPTPGCKGCHMVQHLGLLIAVPKERREEILEDMEFSIRHLVEAARNGKLDINNLERAGLKLKIQSDDGSIQEY